MWPLIWVCLAENGPWLLTTVVVAGSVGLAVDAALAVGLGDR